MFEIRFLGLITHATFTDSGGQQRQAAILYNVPQMPHKPRMSIRPTEFDETSTAPFQKSPNARCFKLGGVVNSDLTGGPVNVNLPDLPHLSEICTGSIINDEILTLAPSIQINAIVLLPAGTLTVEDYFENAGSFSGGPPICIPRTVLFRASATANVTFTVNKKTIILHPDAKPYITNLPPMPPPMSPSMQMTHYAIYGNFFKDTRSMITLADAVPPTRCEHGTPEDPAKRPVCVMGAIVSVECSNTQFP